MHIAHRFLLNDIRLAHDSTRYAPSMMELWAELAAHTGYLFVPVAVVGIGLWIARRKRLDMVAVLAAWFLVGSVLYTLTDWRQTKHMMNQVAPAVAAAVVLVWPRRETDEDGEGASSRWSVAGRAVAGGALVVALGLNLLADARLVEDFRSLTISGASDVDGW
jgi:peptidoglycan/LPS O-acetylase OafA/YrhL